MREAIEKELEAAVDNEEFEKAARLRDEIKEMKSAGNKAVKKKK